MNGSLFRAVLNTTYSVCKSNVTNLKAIHTAPVYYAARKGTRAKARAKKVKVEIVKVGFIPHNQRGKKTSKKEENKHVDFTKMKIPIDDVYCATNYRPVIYSAEQAVIAHQETHHPTMMNMPDSLVMAKVELNMRAARLTRYMDTFIRLTLLPHGFPRDEERTVLAFCKGAEIPKQVVEAGATLAGGTELIKKIQEGSIKVADYDYVIAHPNIITELVPIRGLLKKKFPNLKQGTLSAEMTALVKKLSGGVQYKAFKDETQQDYGYINVPVGRLSMDAKQVAENIGALLKDIQSARPKREGLFITRCIITSPPTEEAFDIDPFEFVDREIPRDDVDSDDEDQPIAVVSAA